MKKSKYKYLIICKLMFITTLLPAQNISQENIMRFEDISVSLDTSSFCLYSISINNDTLSVAFRKALVFYPELCGQKIRLQYGRSNTSMSARPRIWSVFVRRDNRTYKVIVNNNPQKAQTQLLYSVPFNASVGIMGHELAHILDYKSKSGWQIIWTGIRYSGKRYRRTIEQQTDMTTIERGLGWQLYHFSYFLIHHADIDDKYREYKLDIYMRPEEILELIK